MRPYILTFYGLPGTGKSTVAPLLARALGVRLIVTDEIRREFEAQGRVENVFERELWVRAEDALRAAEGLVLDSDPIRKLALLQAFAARHGAEIYFVQVTCPDDVARERLRARTLAVAADPGASASRAGVQDFEWRVASRSTHAVPEILATVDTTQSLPEQVDAVVARLSEARGA